MYTVHLSSAVGSWCILGWDVLLYTEDGRGPWILVEHDWPRIGSVKLNIHQAKAKLWMFSISNQTVAFSLCSITLYGSRYVVVDCLIKPEQRTLMGSYHASWGEVQKWWYTILMGSTHPFNTQSYLHHPRFSINMPVNDYVMVTMIE